MTLWEYTYISIYHLRKRMGCKSADEPFCSLLVFTMLEYIGWLAINMMLLLVVLPRLGVGSLRGYIGLGYIVGVFLLPAIGFISLYKRFPYLEKEYRRLSNKTMRTIVSVCYYVMAIAIWVAAVSHYKGLI